MAMTSAVPPTALILAGERPGGDPLAHALGVRHKALIEIGGRTMLARVHAALVGAGLTRIVVATGDAAVADHARELCAEVMAAQAGPSGSVAAVFGACGAPLLVTTSDHALLRSDWVRQFLADTRPDCDVAALLARREAVETALTGAQRTWLRFADGDWSGCNLFLLQRPAAAAALELWSEVEANRKRPWRIALLLGLPTLLGYALGRLTLVDAIARLGRRAGVDARIVAAHDGLAAVDVDKPSDLALVKGLLADETPV